MIGVSGSGDSLGCLVIHQHDVGELIFDANYLGGPRSQDYVLIVITTGRPRDTPTKQHFYRNLVERLNVAPGIDPEDVMVVITTTASDEWPFAWGGAVINRPAIFHSSGCPLLAVF